MKITYENALKEYTFRRKHGKIHIKKYIGNGGKVEIPQFIDEFPVTKIARSAFAYSEITEVIIPDGIRIICDSAFYECKKLKKIILHGRIDYCSFAFRYSAIEEIDGIEYLISCDDTSFNGTPFYENTETLIIGDKLLWCREKSDIIHVPDYIKKIGYCAFRHSEAKKIILPENLEKIESLAFCGSSINEIYIPDSVTEFHGSSLSYCYHLEKIRFPEDFCRRKKWSCIFDLNEKNYIINDTQLAVRSDDDILIYENVSCIIVDRVFMWNPLRLRERQIFPERLEYLKYTGILVDAKVNVFKNDTFKIGKSENLFNRFMCDAVNISRRFELIFDFNDVYAEVLLWIPFVPYFKGRWEYILKSGLLEFYEKCLVNADDGKFLDLNFYDSHILEQDIPPRIKTEIASKRIESGYRLTEKATDNYRKYLTKSIH
ncbi:MAG: leucine-rich repeat domain-containing protein [Alistipes senegalensis]|nr:leucine-rich repeat domain-containing protein [Alistipes senegalensis]